MNIEHFGAFKTGYLVPISPDGRYHDHAFVPNELPLTWEPGKSLLPLLLEARDRVAELNGVGRYLPTPALLLRPLQRREAIKSNTIEGTFVTPEELLLFEAERNKGKYPNNEQRNDWREVYHYDFTLAEGCKQVVAGRPINCQLLCELHQMLLGTTRGSKKNPGIVRDTQVYVDGNRYIPPPVSELERLLANLDKYLSSDHGDALVRAFIAHYQFEAIHPFKDGNGRIGRLMLSLCIFKWLKHNHAWLYMSEFFEKNRKAYIQRMYSVSTSGEWEEWIEFCLRGAIEQAESAIATCDNLLEIRKQYESLVGHLGSRMNTIIARLLSNPIVNISKLARELGVSYPTVRSDIAKFVSYGILEELENSRPKAFVARRLFDAAYFDER